MKLPRLLAVYFIVLGTSFFSSSANANGTWQANNGNVSGNTVQFDYRGGSATYVTSVSDGSTVTVTINNTIANCIGTCNPIPDVWTLSINGQSYSGNTIEIRNITAEISGQLTIAATGRDVGFWGGWYGPIITVSIATPTPLPTPTPETSSSPIAIETPTVQAIESPTVTLTPEPTPSPEPSPSPSVIEPETNTVSITPSPQPSETATPLADTSTVLNQETPITPSPEPAPSVPSVPPAVEPQPVPQPQPEPAPQPEPVPSPQPEIVPEPQPEQSSPVEEPLPEPVPEPVPEPEPVVEEPVLETPTEPEVVAEPEPLEPEVIPTEPEPTPELTQPEPPVLIPEPTVPEVVQLTASTDLSTLPPDTPIELENGVVLTAEVVIALTLLENPAELLAELFTDPGAVMTALSNIGADMSPEVREQSEKVIIAAVIAGNIATQAAAAASLAAYRRNP